MINILVNDKTIPVKKENSLQDILLQVGHDGTCCTIAINRIFIPRADHATTYLNEGDRIEMIEPMQGG